MIMDTHKLSSLIAISLLPLAASAQDLTQAQLDSIDAQFTQLEELVIEAPVEVIHSDGAKTTYDLDSDKSAKGQSLLEAIRKMPTVSTDGEDHIYLNGNSGVKFYINGSEDAMLTANYTTLLKAMPASMASKIEIISEPGAKYDAEGTAGIINIVTTRKQHEDGYAGNASVSGGSQSLGANIYGKMKKNKFTADASLNYTDNNPQKQVSMMDLVTTDATSTTNHTQKMSNDQKIGMRYVGANFNMSWQPSEADLLTWSAAVNDLKADIYHLENTTDMYDIAGQRVWGYAQNGSGNLTHLGADTKVGYSHTFRQCGKLIGSYRFNYGASPMTLYYLNSDMFQYAALPLASSTFTRTIQREHTAALDYSQSWMERRHLLEVGAKGIFRRNGSLSQQSEGDNPAELVIIEEETQHTRQIQNIYAVYASYTGIYGPLTTEAGLRYEHSYLGLDFLNHAMPDFRRNLNDVVPNASLTYNLATNQSLRLAYQMRISRPDISQLNPFRLQLTQAFAQEGNPDLTSEHHNKISLNYSNFGRVFGGNVGLEYQHTGNSIQSITKFDGNTQVNTFANVGCVDEVLLSGFLNYNISNRMNVNVNAGLSYKSLKAGNLNLSNQGWSVRYGANWSYRGPWSMTYSAYMGGNTRSINLQGHYGGMTYYGLSVSKAWLKDDALTLTLNAANFAQKYMTIKSHTATDGRISEMTFKIRCWNVGLTLSWNFGHLTEQVKSTGADLQNDDKSSAGGNSLMGI